MGAEKERQLILITDDSDINRMILADMLEDTYDILEADCGKKALEIIDERKDDIDIVLLDFVMPEMDGFQVLTELNRRWKSMDIPVIMISAESDQNFIVKAYKLGALDYICRPFNAAIVRHRVDSIMKMHLKEQHLARIATSQIMDKHANTHMMIYILSSIVEFRNGESGQHILHVQNLTDMLLHELLNVTDKYHLTDEEISMIPTVAALHDVGKISIPYHILNKPGRFTQEEFEIMKTHTTVGYDMLTSVEAYRDNPFLTMATQVCRWHHERYDGKGYPDGLVGDDIPISAQLVSVADVYDALTSERCYKQAYSHEKALDMIMGGECGAFNPLLLECLNNLKDDIPEMMNNSSVDAIFQKDIYRIIENTLRAPHQY
ncbi:MAG: response regulator [Lachnospiraceae bacterium]|nr:response regulator [Lachnospiraceae bacterium]